MFIYCPIEDDHCIYEKLQCETCEIYTNLMPYIDEFEDFENETEDENIIRFFTDEDGFINQIYSIFLIFLISIILKILSIIFILPP